MEAQDKITEKIKEAARKMESAPAFPSMERVWQKLEERLEEPQQKRILPFWKKGIAAAVLVLIGLSAFYLLRRDEHKEEAGKNFVQTPTQKALPGNGQQDNKPGEKAVVQTPVKKAETSSQPQQKKLAYHKTKRAVTGVRDHTEAVPPGEDIVAVQLPENKGVSVIPPENVLRKITGKVVDEKLEPMPGVSVVIKGSTAGTTTDMNGNYTIEVSGAPSLVMKSMGVNDKEVALSDRNNNLITKLETGNTNTLGELSIYGRKMDKRSYTGSLTTVTAKDIARRPVADIAKAIDGAAPGVLVSSGGGQPGATPDIVMRGVGSVAANNAPLIVLDGKPYNGTLASIDPRSVDKMTLLKDSTATTLYGSRGTNGVIIINSKKDGSPKSFFKKIKRIFKKKEKETTGIVIPGAEAPAAATGH